MAYPEAKSARILIRGVNWLGDAVMTTPALQRLRQAIPNAYLALLTPDKLAALWQHHPSLDAVLTFSANEGPWAVARRLRAVRFQTALVLPNSPRSALEPWLAGIPDRIGLKRPWRNWLLTRVVPPRADHLQMRKRSSREISRLVRANEPAFTARPFSAALGGNSSTHQIHDYLHLASALGANPEPLPPLLRVITGEVQETALKFNLASGGEDRFFGLAPGAQYGPAKRWPLDKFIEAGRAIQKHAPCSWLLLGGEGDKQIANELTSALIDSSAALKARVHNLAGRTSLRELCALLRLCRVLLTNDSGPMHVAAALETPVVAIFGSTSPLLTGPGIPGDARHRVLSCAVPCAPCFRRVCPIDLRCMTGVGIQQAVQAVIEAASHKTQILH